MRHKEASSASRVVCVCVCVWYTLVLPALLFWHLRTGHRYLIRSVIVSIHLESIKIRRLSKYFFVVEKVRLTPLTVSPGVVRPNENLEVVMYEFVCCRRTCFEKVCLSTHTAEAKYSSFSRDGHRIVASINLLSLPSGVCDTNPLCVLVASREKFLVQTSEVNVRWSDATHQMKTNFCKCAEMTCIR